MIRTYQLIHKKYFQYFGCSKTWKRTTLTAADIAALRRSLGEKISSEPHDYYEVFERPQGPDSFGQENQGL